MNKYIKATDLAQTLGVDVRTIYTAVKKGDLLGKKISSVLLIDEESVTPWANNEPNKMEKRLKKRIDELQAENLELKAIMRKTAGELLAKGE